jgi:hypothetical protein
VTALPDLAAQARELGRAAGPSSFHTGVLTGLLGWPDDRRAAVVLDPAFVRDAQHAEVLLVPVDGGLGAVAADDAVIEPLTALDGDWARVVLDRPPALVHRCDVAPAVAGAAIVLCADAVGAAEAALAAAVEHVRRREQFGRPLSSLQVVQHRCADMLIDVTVAESAVDAAARADDVVLAASWCKAAVVERCRRVTASAHQLAGGQGIFADAPFHRWYRRVKVAEPVLGTNRDHRAHLAASVIGSAGGPGSARR